jgi:mannose-6-phosphate isomerase-like protein (cupin superfamily)
MIPIFAEPILALPEADIPLRGIHAYLSQGQNHQIIFMQFDEDVDLPEHAHEDQIGFVLEGRIDMIINGKGHSFRKGDRYYIPRNTPHSARIRAGYADITFFNQVDRYRAK